MFPFLNKKISIRLASDKIYIFFTRLGLYFIAFLFLIFLLSLSYGNSFAYSILFLAFSILSISALYTNYTLDKIKLDFLGPEVVEQSKNISFNIKNLSNLYKIDIYLQLNKTSESKKFSLSPFNSKSISVSLKSFEPGKYFLKRAIVLTEFPFKLMFSWKYKKVKKDVYIFPDPIEHKEEINPYRPMNSEFNELAKEALHGDEFHSFKHYQEGESTKFINWKYYSKHGELLTKTFESGEGLFIFVGEEFLEGLKEKERLEQIAFWCELALSGGIPMMFNLSEVKTNLGLGKDFYQEKMKIILQKIGKEREIGV